MITRIEAKNYRCLRGVSQSLGNFHVVAGPNGSGKSTFFEVPRVMSAFGRDGLDALWAESATQQFEELLFHGQGESFELAIEMAIPEDIRQQSGQNGKAPKFVRYEVKIGREPAEPDSGMPQILAENLWLFQEGDAKRPSREQMELSFPTAGADEFEVIHKSTPRSGGWKVAAKKTKKGSSYFQSEMTEWNLQIRNAPDESALRSLPSDDRFPISNWFRTQLLEGLQHLNLRSEDMRRPSPPLKKSGFLPDGSNLPQVIELLKSTDKHSFDGWIDHLRTVLPIEDVSVITREEDKNRYLMVRYKSGSSVPSWHLSDGTLRLLAMTVLAYQGENRSVYFIEEPENGIHPQAMEAVFQSLSSVYEGQVLVATHSPVLVGLIEPAQLLCFSKTPAGETDVITGDKHPRLRDWKEGVPLSRLYVAGVLS